MARAAVTIETQSVTGNPLDIPQGSRVIFRFTDIKRRAKIVFGKFKVKPDTPNGQYYDQRKKFAERVSGTNTLGDYVLELDLDSSLYRPGQKWRLGAYNGNSLIKYFFVTIGNPLDVPGQPTQEDQEEQAETPDVITEAPQVPTHDYMTVTLAVEEIKENVHVVKATIQNNMSVELAGVLVTEARDMKGVTVSQKMTNIAVPAGDSKETTYYFSGLVEDATYTIRSFVVNTPQTFPYSRVETILYVYNRVPDIDDVADIDPTNDGGSSGGSSLSSVTEKVIAGTLLFGFFGVIAKQMITKRRTR